jgi:hypothetical protein
MASVINNPSVNINNNPVPVVANSVVLVEGLGEQDLKVESTGGGNVIQVYCDNIETKISQVNFDMLNTVQNINQARGWKVNKNLNTITITGKDSVTGDSVTRTIVGAALTNNYEIELSSDGKLSLEFKGQTAV